ncbi:MAG: GIY-YIG nuclease family protein [Proteobacteria bacterium]|nr:GIY-YIG nuclease family protein [Pseudomonadota bacterium]
MMRGAKKHHLSERDPERHLSMSDAVPSFVYLLPCRHEDILKVGLSRDPLSRMRTLHPRFFEFFDLERGLLVSTESVTAARALEAELFADAADHSAPAPLLVPHAAGGHTEWFRGAGALLGAAARRRCEAGGHRLHACLGAWVRARMAAEAACLYESSSHLMRAIEVADAYGMRDVPVEESLRNLLDSFVAAGVDLAPRVPATVAAWYAGSRSRGAAGRPTLTRERVP